jgi:cell division protein FtsL
MSTEENIKKLQTTVSNQGQKIDSLEVEIRKLHRICMDLNTRIKI